MNLPSGAIRFLQGCRDDRQVGLYFNEEARDRCWGRGMFRGYVSGYVSGMFRVCFAASGATLPAISGVCFGGYVSGYVTGYVSRVCNPCALLKPEPPKKNKPKCSSCSIMTRCPSMQWPRHIPFSLRVIPTKRNPDNGLSRAELSCQGPKEL